MALTQGNFEPLKNVDSEVQSLYRIRDNDQEYRNKPGKLIDPKLIYNRNIDAWAGSQTKLGIVPVDPHWLKMTEDERIENGYPSRFHSIMMSPFGFVFTIICGSKL